MLKCNHDLLERRKSGREGMDCRCQGLEVQTIGGVDVEFDIGHLSGVLFPDGLEEPLDLENIRMPYLSTLLDLPWSNEDTGYVNYGPGPSCS